MGRPFQKGQSGNPGGRPRGCEEVRELARAFTTEAVTTLVEVMKRGKSEGARIAAANTLLERGWGRPLQQVEVKRSSLDGFTTGQLLAALETVERALAVAGDDSEKLVSELGREFLPTTH